MGPRARSWVLALAGKRSYPTLESVGQAVGISRERVRQILRGAGRTEYAQAGRIAHRHAVLLCPGCGRPKSRYAGLCWWCRYPKG